MIVSLDTGAGRLLLDERAAGPCRACLSLRLRDAGFAVGSATGGVAVTGRVRRLLRRSSDPAAPVLRLARGDATLHALLAVPECARCRPRRPPRRGSLPPELLRDPLLGITSALERHGPDRDARALCHTAVALVHLPGGACETSLGAGHEAAAALDAQLGEAVERYAAFRPDRLRLVLATARDLGPDTTRTLAAGSDTSGRRAHQRPLAWIEGRRVEGGERALVPAAWVFLDRAWNPAEVRLGPLTSSGLASHTSTARARERAALELLERHHLALALRSPERAARLPPGALGGRAAALPARIRDAGLELELLDLAPGGPIPTALAAIRGAAAPWVSVGAAARDGLEEAVEAAALEAAGLWEARRARPGGPWSAARAGGLRRRLSRLSARAAAASRAPRRRSRRDPVDVLAELAPEAVEVSITTPDCRACGFEVVRLVAPGLPLAAPEPASPPA